LPSPNFLHLSLVHFVARAYLQLSFLGAFGKVFQTNILELLKAEANL